MGTVRISVGYSGQQREAVFSAQHRGHTMAILDLMKWAVDLQDRIGGGRESVIADVEFSGSFSGSPTTERIRCNCGQFAGDLVTTLYSHLVEAIRNDHLCQRDGCLPDDRFGLDE